MNTEQILRDAAKRYNQEARERESRKAGRLVSIIIAVVILTVVGLVLTYSAQSISLKELDRVYAGNNPIKRIQLLEKQVDDLESTVQVLKRTVTNNSIGVTNNAASIFNHSKE